jgi:hypothetical protein
MGESKFKASPGKTARPYLKNKQTNKRTGGMAQVVQYLHIKCGPEFNPWYCRKGRKGEEGWGERERERERERGRKEEGEMEEREGKEREKKRMSQVACVAFFVYLADWLILETQCHYVARLALNSWTQAILLP